MNILIANITLIILILLIYWQVRIWKWHALLSPGLYFGVIWVLGVLGVIVYDSVGILKTPYPEYIDELNSFIAFTGFCFLILTRVGKKNIDVHRSICLYAMNKFSLFTVLSIILFVTALATFIWAGASFNMGESRVNMHDNVAKQSFFVGYASVLSLPLSIYAGYEWGSIFKKEKKYSKLKKIVLCVPLLANLLFSIYLGGRVNFVYSFIQYIIGFCLSIPIQTTFRLTKKLITSFIIAFILISSFITLVAAQRQEYQTGSKALYAKVTSDNVLLSLLYGPMEYVGSTYSGYQYRRVDAVDLDNLGYGIYTFNGFINWTIPFAGRFGFDDVSIANYFNVYYNNQETYDYKRPLFYYTHSCYIPLVKDFGIWGAYPAIFFLVLIAHKLFIKIQKKKVITKFISLFLYYLFLEYWLKSNYYGTLSNTVLIPLYGWLTVDILNSLFYKK